MIEEDFTPPGQVFGVKNNYFNNNHQLNSNGSRLENGDTLISNMRSDSVDESVRIGGLHQTEKKYIVKKLLSGEKLTYTENSMMFAALIVSTGGLIFGYEVGIIAGTLSQISGHFSLTNDQEAFLVSILYLGSIIGAGLSGILLENLSNTNGDICNWFIIIRNWK